MNLKKYFIVYSSLLLAMVCWSMTFIWYKQAYPHLTPLTLVTLRLSIASVLLLIVSLAFGKLKRIRRKDIPGFVILALFEPFIYFLGESYGMKYLSPTLASLIISTMPLFTPFFAFYLLKERPTMATLCPLSGAAIRGRYSP